MSLSHGLGRLAVSGNRIVQARQGTPVLLRGINRSGMEYRGASGEQWEESEFDRMICEWGANIVRIPFNQEWALAREDYDPAAYLAALDHAVELSARRGAYTLLALQWLDNHTIRGYDDQGRPNFVPPLPNVQSIELWRQLASRYSGQPAVLFDLVTEPHDVLTGDEIPVPSGVRVRMAEWQPRARALIDAIRESHPEALIFVSGVNWGYDLRGFPLPGVEGVVYSTHVYRNKGNDWGAAFGNLAATVPVFAAEWGGDDEDVEWGRELAAYFGELRIGWTAWGWPDSPPLIDGSNQATRFGGLVRSLLKK